MTLLQSPFQQGLRCSFLVLLFTSGCENDQSLEYSDLELTYHSSTLPSLDASLEVVGSFGWEDLSDATRPLTAMETEYGGGVLGSIAGVAEGPDGALYVADRDFQKIVVFSPDGTLRNVIFGGFGEGPGEFIRIRDISVGPDGRVGVLDQGNNRITIFTSSGEYLTSFALETTAALGLVLTSEVVLVLQGYQTPNEHALRAFTFDGDTAGEFLEVSGRTAHFADYGNPGQLTALPDGGALFGFPMPGRWAVFDDMLLTPGGREFFPEASGYTYSNQQGRQVRSLPVEIHGIGRWSDGSTLIGFIERPPPDADERGYSVSLAITSPSDSLLGTLNITQELGRVFYLVPSRTAPEFFTVTAEPYPQVLRVRVDGLNQKVAL